jgi:hypothetical protein
MWQIINGIVAHEIINEKDIEPYLLEYERRFGTDYIPNHYYKKVHTIREDKLDRWKTGMDIHLTINNRTKQRFQFAPRIKVFSTQKIIIEKSMLPMLGNNSPSEVISIKVDGKNFDDNADFIASNDGFHHNRNLFFDFWPEGRFEGKIIHWTPLKY